MLHGCRGGQARLVDEKDGGRVQEVPAARVRVGE